MAKSHSMKSLAPAVAFAVLLSCGAFAQQACDYKVEILVDGNEFEKEDFMWRIRATKLDGPPTNITGTAEIKSNGKAAKSYKPWNSAPISRQKTSNEYTPNLKPGSYEIVAEINVYCEDTNKDNNKDAKEIRINGEVDEKKKSVKKEASDEKKGSKQAEAQKPTATSSPELAAMEEKEEFDNVIHLAGKNVQKKQPQAAITTKAPKIVYKSGSEKAKGMVMAFLLTLSVLLNIILIWKR